MIGDYGVGDKNELAVAKLVSSQNPDFVVTAGDNYYREAGGRGTSKYDKSAGAYYGAWMKDVPAGGSGQAAGTAAINGFFPILGNHDYTDATPSLETYLDYFTLPGTGFTNTSGNERYYDFVQGPVHFFVLNSNPQEPDGTSATSKQAQWLQTQLAASTSPWNIVFAHHPPYSSDNVHGSTPRMQWPFAAWGADAVISGHVHTYERLVRDGTVYFVNGLGGEAPQPLLLETGGRERVSIQLRLRRAEADRYPHHPRLRVLRCQRGARGQLSPHPDGAPGQVGRAVIASHPTPSSATIAA